MTRVAMIRLPLILRRPQYRLAYVLMWLPYGAFYELIDRFPIMQPRELSLTALDRAIPFVPSLVPLYVAYIPFDWWTGARSEDDETFNAFSYATHFQLCVCANVDWERTQAYSYGRHYGSLFLNVKGREPRGLIEPGASYERARDEIAAAVLAYRDPQLGRPLVSRVIRREEVYRGARFEEAPDLILIPWDEADIFYGLSDFGSSRIWDQTYRYSGMHRDNGVLAVCGPGIRRGAQPASPNIVDLAPTILHLLGQQGPDDMDGRVLEELFEPGFAAAHPVRRSVVEDRDGQPGGARRDYSADEEAEVLERLRDLGYLN